MPALCNTIVDDTRLARHRMGGPALFPHEMLGILQYTKTESYHVHIAMQMVAKVGSLSLIRA